MALAQTSIGNIIVACGENKGLVEISKDGEYIRHIEQAGSFHDVTICSDLMAAFEYSSGTIYVYEYKQSKIWEKKYKVKPQVNDSLNSILLHYGLLIVGSVKGKDENRICVYDNGNFFRNHSLAGKDLLILIFSFSSLYTCIKAYEISFLLIHACSVVKMCCL